MLCTGCGVSWRTHCAWCVQCSVSWHLCLKDESLNSPLNDVYLFHLFPVALHKDYFITSTLPTFTTTVLRPFVRDYLGELVPEETFTHHSYSDHQSYFICFLHLLRSIASSQFKLCAWQSLHNLFPSPFCSASWFVILHFILHSFFHPIIVFFFAIHAHTNATCFLYVKPKTDFIAGNKCLLLLTCCRLIAGWFCLSVVDILTVPGVSTWQQWVVVVHS